MSHEGLARFLTTRRSAAWIFVALVLWAIGLAKWTTTVQAAATYTGLPAWTLFVALLVFFLAASVLAFAAAESGWHAGSAMLSEWHMFQRVRGEATRAEEGREARLREVLPLLSANLQETLRRFARGHALLDKDEADVLLRENIIREVMVDERGQPVYKLETWAAPMVEDFLREQRSKEIRNRLTSASEGERSVFALFARAVENGTENYPVAISAKDLKALETFADYRLLTMSQAHERHVPGTKQGLLPTRSFGIIPDAEQEIANMLGQPLARRSITCAVPGIGAPE
jgi:hypothetical protein